MATPSAGRGQTWSAAEIRCLLDVWAEDFIDAQLSTTHKNSDIFATFSKRLRASGFNRSIAQCRVKVKKLRGEYIKIRDAIAKSGADGTLKEKFPWYDQIDDILGTKPIVNPVDIVENLDHSPGSSSSTESATTDPAFDEESGPSVTADDHNLHASTDAPSPGPSVETVDPSRPSVEGGRLRIPGARTRKRKGKTSTTDREFREYMEEVKQGLEESHAADQRQDTMFKELFQAQLDAEERRFQAAQEARERRHRDMQTQQRATTEMFTQLLNTIASLQPGPPPSTPHWPTAPSRPAPTTTSTWLTPHQQHVQHSHNQHYPNAQQRKPEEASSTSSFLSDLNKSHMDYSNL